MYRILTSQQEQRTHGDPLAPGGQRIVTSWVVTVGLPDGATRSLTFLLEPTDQEILDTLPLGRALVPTTKLGWEAIVEPLYQEWLRWKTTRLEAEARAFVPPVITALTTKEDAAWGEYAVAVNAWRLSV